MLIIIRTTQDGSYGYWKTDVLSVEEWRQMLPVQRLSFLDKNPTSPGEFYTPNEIINNAWGKYYSEIAWDTPPPKPVLHYNHPEHRREAVFL